MSENTSTLTLLVDDEPHQIPVENLRDEDDQTCQVAMFDVAYQVLEVWRNHDIEHRKFGWTSDADDLEPDAAFAVWVDATGVLQIDYLDPFFDGTGTVNGYEVEELTRLPTIHRATRA